MKAILSAITLFAVLTLLYYYYPFYTAVSLVLLINAGILFSIIYTIYKHRKSLFTYIFNNFFFVFIIAMALTIAGIYTAKVLSVMPLINQFKF